MTSKNLIQMLKRIGYPDADNINPQALDWAFENEKTEPFLMWLCHSINEQNVLSDKELESYRKLQESGQVINGAHLEEALGQVSLLTSSNISQSNLNEITHSLEKAKERRTRLIKTNKKLDLKQFSVSTNTSQLEKLMEKEDKSYQIMVERSHKHDVLMLEGLEKLTASVNTLMVFYKNTNRSNSHGEEKGSSLAFLTQINLEDYHEAEEQFSRDLTAFTRKRFSEDMVAMSGQRDKHNYDIIDVASLGNTPSSKPGDREQSEDREEDDNFKEDGFLEDCLEFAHLQQIFPQSEIDRINSLVDVDKAVSAIQEAKSTLHQLRTGHFPQSAAEISQGVKTMEETISKNETEASSLISGITNVVKQLGSLQGTEILTGNYDLKLKRQEYFTSSQDMLIKYLVLQRSRNEFLSLLYELELKLHKEIHHLLSAVEQTLQQHLDDWKQRMTDLDDPDLRVATMSQNVVDSRDKSTARLYQMMENSSKSGQKDLYLPVTKVNVASKKLYESYESAQRSDKTLKDEKWNRMLDIESCSEECEKTLYLGSSTSSGVPSLSPANVQAALSSLKSSVQSLTENIESVFEDINAKQKTLKKDVLHNKERDLFALFHTKPERLQTLVDGLADKLKVLNMTTD